MIEAPTFDAGLVDALRTAACAGVIGVSVPSAFVLVNMFSRFHEFYWIVRSAVKIDLIMQVRSSASPR